MTATTGFVGVCGGRFDRRDLIADRADRGRGVDDEDGVDAVVLRAPPRIAVRYASRVAPPVELRGVDQLRDRPPRSVADASTVGLVELLTMATRSPCISGWAANTRTVSSSAVTVGTSIIPVCS